jgi:hypothetical protein
MVSWQVADALRTLSPAHREVLVRLFIVTIPIARS